MELINPKTPASYLWVLEARSRVCVERTCNSYVMLKQRTEPKDLGSLSQTCCKTAGIKTTQCFFVFLRLNIQISRIEQQVPKFRRRMIVRVVKQRECI